MPKEFQPYFYETHGKAEKEGNALGTGSLLIMAGIAISAYKTLAKDQMLSEGLLVIALGLLIIGLNWLLQQKAVPSSA